MNIVILSKKTGDCSLSKRTSNRPSPHFFVYRLQTRVPLERISAANRERARACSLLLEGESGSRVCCRDEIGSRGFDGAEAALRRHRVQVGCKLN